MTVTRNLQRVSTGPTLVVADSFGGYGTGATITDYTSYNGGTFPNEGTWTGNPSSIWEMDTGWLTEASGFGYSGRPIDWPPANPGTDKYFFRLRTIDTSVKNQYVKWTYKSAGTGVDGYTADEADAVDVWLRYQTQFNLYFIQFDRSDNEDASPGAQRIYVKRKVPAYNWTGPGGNGALDNKGRYYYIPCDQTTEGGYYRTWANLGLSELAHDSSTTYQFEATCVTIASGVVQFKLWRNGVFVASWTDDHNNGLNPPGTGTLADEVAAGYFTSVTGYQSSWYQPIDLPGATGWRSDNRKCWFKDFALYDLG